MLSVRSKRMSERRVLPHLVLVAHDGHLALEILLGDVAVQHPVRLETERPRDVRVARGKRLEIVRAVEERARVVACPARREFGRDVRMLRRPLEVHVLEQVRHSRLAVAFVPRADQVRDVDGRRRLARVREDQDAESVGEIVLRDPLDGRALGHALRKLRRQRAGDEDEHRGQSAAAAETERSVHRSSVREETRCPNRQSCDRAADCAQGSGKCLADGLTPLTTDFTRKRHGFPHGSFLGEQQLQPGSSRSSSPEHLQYQRKSQCCFRVNPCYKGEDSPGALPVRSKRARPSAVGPVRRY